MKRFLLMAALLCGAMTSQAKVTLPALLNDNAVLQRNSQITLWGKATPNRRVTITPSWSGKKYTTKANAKGEWSTEVATTDAGVGYSITFDDGDKVTINNILLGEVWLTSGQSNMEMPMIGYGHQPVTGAANKIAKAKASTPIRYFRVNKATSDTPCDNVEGLGGSWGEHTPKVVSGFSATAYFFAEYIQEVLEVPVGIVDTNWGGTPIEAWMSPEMLHQVGDVDLSHLEDGKTHEFSCIESCCLYNAMMHPLLNLRFKGMLWYQGETNMDYPEAYKKLFPAFIEGLRSNFKCGEFPVYYAEIAPYTYGHNISSAIMREAMGTLMDRVDNCGMISLLDKGESILIHPRDKKAVGERFAYWALGHAYGIEGITYKSPRYESFKVVEADEYLPKRLALSFTDDFNGICFHQDVETKLFEVAGEDRIFYPASVRQLANDEYPIEVWSEKVPNPVAVRYAYKDFVTGDIFGITGLPVPSFRSDDWPVK